LSDRARPGEVVLGLVGVVIGAILVQQTAGLPVAATYARISPRLIPFIVGGGLAALGLVMALAALPALRARAMPAEPFERTDWRALAIALVALLAHAYLIEPLGFVPASILLFVAMAWALGSRSLGRDLLAGTVLAVVVWLALGKGLGLRLPMGPLEGIL